MSQYQAEHETDDVFRHLTSLWLKQIQHAKKHKKEVFGAAADEALQFYNGPKSWDELMGGTGRTGITQEDDFPDPMFKISVNKTFEFVTIFGPALYYENPVRTVKPRMPVDLPPGFFPTADGGAFYNSLLQQEQTRVMEDGLKATLLGAYLNWTPHEFDLSTESRTAIDEALIMGRGLLWTELYVPPGAAFQTVRSYFDSVVNLLVDPDAPSLDRAKWIARRCVAPVWELERDYGLPKGAITKGTAESHARQADIETSEEAQDTRSKGLSNDIITYWKIWSKMGVGGRLPGSRKEYQEPLEVFGDYAYVVVCPNCPYFLNLPPHVSEDPSFASDPEQVFGRMAWPTPFWSKDAWPCSVLDFHVQPNCPWPLPHIRAGIGELKFLNWIHSFLAGHIRNASRDFVAILKSAPEELKTAILHGKDLELLEIDSEHQNINEIVQFLQHPQMNGDIWKVIAAVENNFDKRVGLTELMYGTTETQIRSAEEASIKNQNMNVRPADMARQVETWQAEVAAKEAMCARYHLISEDTRPVLGAMGGWAWDTYVKTDDIQVAARELEYQIEAGSTQKPNKDFEVRQMTEAAQTLLPVFQQYAQTTGDVSPLNNLLSDYAKSRDLDPARYQLQMAPPPPPMPADAGGAGSVQNEKTDNMIPNG